MLWSRLVLILINTAYLGVAFWTGEARVIASTLVFLPWPSVFIWFADDLANTTWIYVRSHRVSKASPANLVRVFGFVMLIAPVAGVLMGEITRGCSAKCAVGC